MSSGGHDLNHDLGRGQPYGRIPKVRDLDRQQEVVWDWPSIALNTYLLGKV
jgi:hypothetical protein